MVVPTLFVKNLFTTLINCVVEEIELLTQLEDLKNHHIHLQGLGKIPVEKSHEGLYACKH